MDRARRARVTKAADMPIFQQLTGAAGKRGLRFLVIGGHAVIAHGYPRTTFDLELLVERERSPEWDALLAELGYRILARQSAFVQFTPPTPQG